MDEFLFLRIRDLLFIPFGEDRFGGDTVHPDPKRANLGGYILRQNLNAGFGSRVGDGRLRVRCAPGRGGDSDDNVYYISAIAPAA